MKTLRALLIALAGFICILAISGFISLLTLRTTVMDQTVVKGWLNTSKIYDGTLVSVLAQAINAGNSQSSLQQPQTGVSVPQEALTSALQATFTPDFVKSQVESVISNAYDWSEGKTPAFTFSIPIDQKRDTLIQQLATAIEPQIASLPICQSFEQIQESTCRPAGLTVEQFSSQVTAESVNKAGTFDAPITSQSVAKDAQPETSPSPLAQLPVIHTVIDMLLIILPIAIIVSIATVIFVTAKERRLQAAARLSRRIFFSMLLIVIPAIVAVWIAGNNDLGLSNNFNPQIGDLIVPIIKIAVVGISTKLALLSGIVCVVSLVAWIGFTIWRRKTQELEAMRAPAPTPVLPTLETTPPVQPPQDTK
jgi:membrane-associated HD superfamily phosphohydrolase